MLIVVEEDGRQVEKSFRGTDSVHVLRVMQTKG